MDTHIRYVARSSIFETEKAFTTDFPVDHVEGARRTNQEEDHRPVTINCIENPNEWKLDEHGFCFIKAETHVEAPYTLDNRNEIQKSYWQQIEAIVHKKFPQYSRIESFDFTVSGLLIHRPIRFTDMVCRFEKEMPISRKRLEAIARNTFLQLLRLIVIIHGMEATLFSNTHFLDKRWRGRTKPSILSSMVTIIPRIPKFLTRLPN